MSQSHCECEPESELRGRAAFLTHPISTSQLSLTSSAYSIAVILSALCTKHAAAQLEVSIHTTMTPPSHAVDGSGQVPAQWQWRLHRLHPS